MIIFTTCFILFKKLLSGVLGGIFGNSEAMHTILAIAIFAAIALYFIPNAKSYALGVSGVFIVAYVAIEVLAPYQSLLTIILAAVVAIIVLVLVKRHILGYLRSDNGRNLPTWVTVCLMLL